jgi:O-antigen/teichoic acid export membrane protein
MQAERGKTLTVQTLSLPALWGTFRTKVIGRKFVWDAGVLTVANFVGAALNIAQGILVARWLGPELYGIAALVMSYPSLVYTFFDARSAEASVKYLSEFHARNDPDRVLAIYRLGCIVDLAIASLACLVVFLTAPWAARKIAHGTGTVDLIILYAVAFIPRALVGSSYAVLATLKQFQMIAWIDIVTALARVALVIALVFLGWQVAGVVWGNVLATILTGLLYGACAYALMQRTWGKPLLQGNWQALKGRYREILGFIAFNDLNALLTMIPQQLDVVLLGYFRNPTEVGYYKLAKSLSSAVNYLVGPLRSVTYPELSRLWSIGDRQGLRQKVRRLAVQVGLPLGLLALIGVLFISPVLLLLVGDSYLPAVSAGQIMIAGNIVWLLGFWLRPLYLALGKVTCWMASGAVSLSFFLPLLPLLAWHWGYLGVAWWSFGLNCLAATLALYRLRKVYRYVAS